MPSDKDGLNSAPPPCEVTGPSSVSPRTLGSELIVTTRGPPRAVTTPQKALGDKPATTFLNQGLHIPDCNSSVVDGAEGGIPYLHRSSTQEGLATRKAEPTRQWPHEPSRASSTSSPRRLRNRPEHCGNLQPTSGNRLSHIWTHWSSKSLRGSRNN
jgi:hypothetical protein